MTDMRTSFLIPVYNTELAILRLCINSALKAAGDEHEVVVVDDASDRGETREFLSRCLSSGLDNLKVLRNPENCGVSYSLNKASTIATGALYAPVDHDDMVVNSGFQLMLRSINYYDVGWVYSDEQQISYKGHPVLFMYKPDFSLQLLRSVMYINHLQLISSSLFESVGRYREGFEGSQDHDLALRLSERVVPKHINAIAYLWRRTNLRLSGNYGQISETSIRATKRALDEHFHRRGLTAEVTPHELEPTQDLPKQATGTFISRILPALVPKISIVIPCKLDTTLKIGRRTTITILEHCLQSIRRSFPESNSPTLESPDVEVILVLNQEDDLERADQLIAKFQLTGFSIKDKEGFNFSRKCNLGAHHASGEILVILNDDTDIQTEGWTSHVISLLHEDDVACVGGMLLNLDRTVQSCGDNVGRNSAVHYVPEKLPSSIGDAMHRYFADHETTSITGAFFCCRKTTFESLQGFSLAFPNSFQDVDFCLRARAKGMRCIVSPHIKLLHFESVSRNPFVELGTLFAIRAFHQPMMSPLDVYALALYEKPNVPLFTLTAVRHYMGVAKRTLKSICIWTLIHSRRLPSHPPFEFYGTREKMLGKSGWRIE